MLKFRGRIFVLLLLPGVLAATAVQWGEELMLYRLQPAQPWAGSVAPPAPDYRKARSWAALPGLSSPALLAPAGARPAAARAPVDVFYIHPTSFLSGSAWNAPLHTDSRAWEMIDVMLAAQASAFNACCEVYAPHYREATLFSFLPESGADGEQALAFAYNDVLRAFREFLGRTGERPFIIASHSQGTFHALRLLAEEVDSQPLQQRLVAAYLVGYWLPMDTFERNLRQISPCQNAADTGCVVHWSTYAEGAQRRAGVPHWYAQGTERSDGKPLLCINPLSWHQDGGRIEAGSHPGALYVEQGGTLLNTLFNHAAGVEPTALDAVKPNWTWAECRDGLLRVAPQTGGAFAEAAAADGDYHILDYNLFYQSVRVNAVLRAAQMNVPQSLASAAAGQRQK